MNRHGQSRGLGQLLQHRRASEEVERATRPQGCTRCGAPVRWLDRRGGGRIPLDTLPVASGRWAWRGDVTWCEPATAGTDPHRRYHAHRCPPPRQAA